MKIKQIFLPSLAVIITLPNAVSKENDTKKRRLRTMVSQETFENRIIGGNNAAINAYPWFVLGNGCGGSLIAPEVFITAGHCSDYRFSTVIIGALCRGGADKSRNNCGQYSESRVGIEFVKHPQYNNGNDGYDFKLVKLNRASTIDPVNIDHGFLSPTYISGRDQLWTAGFGLVSTNPDKVSDSLMELQKEFVDLDECSKLYDLFEKDLIKMDRTMICVKNDDDFRSACFGDSGGPLYDAAAKKLVGVVSTGPPDCARLPIIYASIASEIQWIKETTCALSSSAYQPAYCAKYIDVTSSPSATTVTFNTQPPSINDATFNTTVPTEDATPCDTVESNQDKYFQVISRIDSGFSSFKWCMATTNSTYNSRVTVKRCDTLDPNQIWSSDIRGLIYTKSNPNLCIQNVQSDKGLIMKTCPSVEDPIDSTFVYDQFHKSLIWLRNKGDFATWGLRAVTVIGAPSDDISLNKVSLSKRNEDENQKWDLYFPPI